jgi:hypothetical protein
VSVRALSEHSTAFDQPAPPRPARPATPRPAPPRCGSLLSPLTKAQAVQGQAFAGMVAGVQGPAAARVECCVCGTGRFIERCGLPYVFKYLATELAAMNIKVSLTVA